MSPLHYSQACSGSARGRARSWGPQPPDMSRFGQEATVALTSMTVILLGSSAPFSARFALWQNCRATVSVHHQLLAATTGQQLQSTVELDEDGARYHCCTGGCNSPGSSSSRR